MSWQIFLTVWIIVQLVAEVVSKPSISELRGHSMNHLIGSMLGTFARFIGMLFCLYMGGFYS